MAAQDLSNYPRIQENHCGFCPHGILAQKLITKQRRLTDDITLSKLEDYIESISQKIHEGRVVLFLGAGASAAAGAPQQNELIAEIKKRFPKLDPNLNRLVDVCEDFLETRGYDIKDLEEFITEKLRVLKPSVAHLSLTKYNWPAIFTTNFDDLIETAFRTSDAPAKNCFIVSYPNQAPTTDPRKVYVFKLMGTICTRSDNKMVLSRSDFTKMVSKRAEYLNNLEDFVKDGTIVFIGYSTADRLVTDLIDEVKDKIGFQRMPWSYVLLKDLNISEKDKYRFEMHRMIPIKCTFEEFFEKLDKVKYPEVPSFEARPEGEAITVEGKSIFLSPRELEMYRDFFEILRNGLIPSKAKSKEDFFKGMINDYGCYAEDFDFKRDVYFKSEQKDGKTRSAIKDRVFAELQKRDADQNRVLLVTGPPGVGKSVLLRRLAYDAFTTGQAPVILFDRTRAFFDLKLLSSILVAFDRKFDEASEEKTTHRLKSLIIIDDPSVDPIQVRDYLSSRGRLALLVVACRENEMGDEHTRIPTEDVYRVSEFLSADEKTRIVRHLFDLKILSSPDEKWDILMDKEFANSFFATMYTLVQPARKPLNEVIYDQYVKLDSKSKQAFSYICAFHQFDLPINLELLVRALDCGYDEFYNEILPKTRGIIFEESTQGYLLYTAHHRIIAKKTIEFFFAFSKNQKNLFMELFSRVNLRNGKEKEIIEKLLVNHLSSKSRSTDLSRLEKIEIFQRICSQYEIKSLLHHLGILISDEGSDSQKAGEILTKALAIHERGGTFQRSELDQNILTSLGVLHSKIAIKNMKEKFAHELVEQEIKLAQNYFLKARFGGWPNAHSYHAHAKMFLQLGDQSEDDLRKNSLYSTALDILQDARDNLNEDQLQMIHELEVEAYQKIGKLELSLKKAAEVAKKYHSAGGYTLFASTLINRSHQFRTWIEREPLLKQAMSAVETSLEKFPLDERSLVLRAKLTRRLFPSDNSKYFASLQAWHNNARSPNILLLFELGVSAFKEKQYEYSKRIFDQLENERISGGIKNRYAEQLYLGPNGKPLSFVGVITSIESRYDGFIRCDTLSDLNYPLHFRPIACVFQPAEEDMVDFNIAFDFLGPRAVRVNRI